MAKTKNYPSTKLHLGCGATILPGYVNLDKTKLPGVDVVHDLEKFPYPFKENSFDEILAKHVFAFFPDLLKVMEELHRIMKPNGVLKVVVPYYNSRAAHQDPLTKRFFTLDTFDYFTQNSLYHYYTQSNFLVVKKSITPTALGWFVPKPFRNFVGTMIGNINESIYFELRAVK